MTGIFEAVVSMLSDHWFWGGLTLAVVVWYSTVTVYVAVKGVGDIKEMLKKLGRTDKK
jgi:hypothetical protein